MYYWMMLVLAVVAEVISTVGMKYASSSSPVFGYIVMASMISLSFYAFSRAVVHIPLAVSYAVWEGLGLFLIGIAGVVLFGEFLSVTELCAIGLMLVGLLLVTFDKGQPVEEQGSQALANPAALKTATGITQTNQAARSPRLGEVVL